MLSNNNARSKLNVSKTKCSYRLLVARIKRELPELYHTLALQFYNPYAEQCRQTPTHYILVHSAIEYFIRKQ